MTTGRKPLLVFDGDCNFCRRWVGRWRTLTGERVDYAPSSEAAARLPEIAPERFAASVWLIEPGRRSNGAEAVFRLLAYAPGRAWMLWAYRSVPGAAAACEGFYRLVARRRSLFSRLTLWLWGQDLEPETYHLGRWLFLRLLAAAYLAAFASLWIQASGLLGRDGVLPLQDFLRAAYAQLGPAAYRYVPTVFWLNSSDFFLRFVCALGTALSALVFIGALPGPLLLILWALYLSLAAVGRDFLSFQWDILLLEAGFLAVFLAPWRLWPRPSREAQPPATALWLLRWLLFRLMFESGCVKLLSGDPTWRGLTALNYHYETQPLPTWIGWYAHQLPHWFQRLSVAGVFAIELAAPWLIFLPRRPRLLSCALLLFLQGLIALTGNYCFFNLLAAALCALLVDDATLKGLLPRSLAARLARRKPAQAPPPWRGWLYAPVAALAVAMGSFQLIGMLSGRLSLPRPLAAALGVVEPLRLVNSYGLFAVMTTSRLEISVEGSADGRDWRAYGFRWKPGNPMIAPRFAAPHQPRLDWQMWFAALGRYEESPWFLSFLVRLLEGKLEVLALLADNPFPAAPPRFVRASLYEYRFTNREERRATGAWWKRRLIGPYCPVVSLRDVR